MRSAEQNTLFDAPLRLATGLVYRPDFITPEEEEILLAYIENTHLAAPRYGEYRARRKVKNFGWGYDFKHERFVPGPPLPRFLQPLKNKIAKWLDIPKDRVVEALVTEYPKGTKIGWHRDRESFEHIVGISLKGWCTMQLRCYGTGKERHIVSFDLEPRSAYIMQNDSRWRFEHGIPNVKTHRISITFRTLPRGYVIQ